jgi:hypothetical protein
VLVVVARITLGLAGATGAAVGVEADPQAERASVKIKLNVKKLLRGVRFIDLVLLMNLI